MVQTNDYTKFLQLHEIQLKSSNIPEWYWKTLYIKLKNQVFDSNETFALLLIDYDGETRTAEDPLWIVQIKNEQGLKHDDEKHIYLVDHAWTFRTNQAKQQLEQMPQLLERMCNIMGITADSSAENAVNAIDEVCKLMWKYCHTYSIGNAENIEDRLPIWYIMDELGCGIRHSDEPNFRAVPFFHIPEQTTYTLIFPIKDVEFEEIVTRDFIEGVTDDLQRKAQLIPWVKSDLTHVSYAQNEPEEEYFLSGHVKETLPPSEPFEMKIPDKINVYSEYSMVNKFLTHPRFQLTNDENAADVLWYTRHFKTYAELSETPNKFVNQFPFENVLTIKDLLSIVCRRKNNSNWYPVTYNLKTELPQFISYFQHCEKTGRDNHWICKPWNLARSLDTHITNNLDYIVRLPATGPKIAQKYIEKPVLFNRPEVGDVKFDVRYVILLKSTAPLRAYIYNNFFLRFSNKPFELSDFDDYEKHFTVMNYSEEAQLHHLPCADFLKQWEEQYPAFTWREVEKLIVKMLREVFEAAVAVPPPRGIPPSPQSRAVYAADIMLSWDSVDKMQPKLLEINWTPDCKRACDYYPDFYNDIFSCLFLNDETSNSFTSL